MLALVDGQPQTLPLKAVIAHPRLAAGSRPRRTEYDLGKARERAHILEGLKIALDHLDEIIKLIKKSKDVDDARTQLMSSSNSPSCRRRRSSTCDCRSSPALSARRSRTNCGKCRRSSKNWTAS